MSDRLADLFRQASEQLTEPDWLETDVIQRRAWRRSVATLVASATAVLAMVGAGTALAVGLPRAAPHPALSFPAPSSHATAAPTDPAGASLAIPPSAVLQADDVGPGYVVATDRDWSASAFDGWAWALTGCPRYLEVGPTAYRQNIALRTTTLVRQVYSPGRSAGVLVQQTVRYPRGFATMAMTDYRRLLSACPRFSVASPPGALVAERTDNVYTVLTQQVTFHGEPEQDPALADGGFLIIEHRATHLRGRPLAQAGPVAVEYVVVVHSRDLVTTLTLLDVGVDEATRLKDRAAARLATAADARFDPTVRPEAMLIPSATVLPGLHQANENHLGRDAIFGGQPTFVLGVTAPDCPNYQALGVNSVQRRLDGLEYNYENGPVSVTERIEWYGSGVAREVVADAQRVAQACPEFELYPGLTAGIQVTATGFAGPGSDESVLFEYSTTGVKDQSTLVALIRVGDLIIFLYVPPHLWQTSIAQEAVQAICRAGPEC